MKNPKAREPNPVPAPVSAAEPGSPYELLGYGPRLKRLTVWEPERWQQPREPRLAGLPPASQESMRFHTWRDREVLSLADALYWAKRLARGNLFRNNILVLAGPTGVGKTHLALAIAWEWFEDGFSVVFSRVDDLLDELRRGYEDGSYHRKLERIRGCDLLVLDDLGTEYVRDDRLQGWAAEKLDRIIDWRYLNLMPLAVTTNVRSDDLPPRLASRLADRSRSVVVVIDAQNYRTQEGGGDEAR